MEEALAEELVDEPEDPPLPQPLMTNAATRPITTYNSRAGVLLRLFINPPWKIFTGYSVGVFKISDNDNDLTMAEIFLGQGRVR